MTCPTCGLRQWNYDDATLTCKNGHRFAIGEQPKHPRSNWWLIPAAAAGAAGAAALDLLLRTIT
jgi:hypothetical protein